MVPGPPRRVILAGAGTMTVPGRPAAGVVPLPAPLAPGWPPAAPAGGHLQGRPFGCRRIGGSLASETGGCPAVRGPRSGPRGVIKIPLGALVATELLFPGRIARRARRAMPVPGLGRLEVRAGAQPCPFGGGLCAAKWYGELSGLRTLAALTSQLGVKLGANSGRRRATSGHIGPRTPQVIGIQGDAWRRSATAGACMACKRSGFESPKLHVSPAQIHVRS